MEQNQTDFHSLKDDIFANVTESQEPSTSNKRRKKSIHWSSFDWDHLVDLVLSFREILFPSAGVTVSNQEKGRAWKEICVKFNDFTKKDLDQHQVKKQWHNLQQVLRMRQRHDNSRMTFMSENFFLKISDALPEYCVPLENLYDSDAGFHSTILTADQQMLPVKGAGEIRMESETRINDEIQSPRSVTERDLSLNNQFDTCNDDSTTHADNSTTPINRSRYGNKNKENPSRANRYRKIEHETIFKEIKRELDFRKIEHETEIKRLNLALEHEQLSIVLRKIQLQLAKENLEEFRSQRIFDARDLTNEM